MRAEFWAEGKPVPYNRESAKFGRTPPRNAVWRRSIQVAFLALRIPGTPLAPHVPVKFTAAFYGARSGCDIDNLVKEVQDALNGLAYEDDSQIKEGSWRIADWRAPGVKHKGPKKAGVLITIEVAP